MRRDTLTTAPKEGDYILSFTGFTWNVLRSNGDDSGKSISAGDRDRKTAVARVRSLTEADETDGWESAGGALFSRIAHFRQRTKS